MSGSKGESKTIQAAAKEIVRRDTIKLEGIGKDVSVRVCKVKDIDKFLELLAAIYVDLDLRLGSREDIEGQVIAKLNDGGALLKLISKNMPTVIEVGAAMTDLAQEQVEDLDPDDAVTLVKKLIEINYAFFMAKVMPLFPSVLADKMRQAGTGKATT